MSKTEYRGPHRRSRRASQHGFTLIEITVVALVLGLLASMIFVSWEAMLPNQRMNTAIRELSETLYGTRSDAIARNGEFRIYYDIENDNYNVRTPFLLGGGFAYGEEDDEDRLWKVQRDLKEKGIEILEVTIDDVTYADGVVYVRFDPLGASSYHTVVLYQKQFDRTFTIESLPLTGDIRYHDGYYQRELAQDSDFQ